MHARSEPKPGGQGASLVAALPSAIQRTDPPPATVTAWIVDQLL